MPLGLPTAAVLTGVAVFVLGGTVKGVLGFGYSVAVTSVLAIFVEPHVAVTVMILPMLVANIGLLTELDLSDVKSCAGRFWYNIVAAAVGASLGMTFLDGIPRSYVALSLGVLVLGYVGVKQQIVRPSRPALGRHDLESPVLKTAVGFVSGTVLGASNIGVQTVLYLNSLELDRGTFIGVLSMYFVGISAMRMGAAWFLGFYSGDLLVLSASASFVGLAGVGFGKLLRLSDLLPEGVCRLSFLWLLTLIGIRLVYAGATAVV